MKTGIELLKAYNSQDSEISTYVSLDVMIDDNLRIALATQRKACALAAERLLKASLFDHSDEVVDIILATPPTYI